jgi:hypothetical protein
LYGDPDAFDDFDVLVAAVEQGFDDLGCPSSPEAESA